MALFFMHASTCSMADIVTFIVKTEVLLLNHYLVSKGRHHIKEVFQGFGLVFFFSSFAQVKHH